MDQQTDHQTVNGNKTLDDWRRQIDALDTELLRLLNQRAAIACEIASIKVASGLPAYDGNRERQVLARVVEKNTGPLDQQSITDIFPASSARRAAWGRNVWKQLLKSRTLSLPKGREPCSLREL
jgi:chorismate mutase